MSQPNDLLRIERNVRKMIDLGAPAPDVDAYLSEEGYTPETFRASMIEKKAPKDDRGFMERSGRALGLGARDVIEGVAAPVLQINDAIGSMIGLGGSREALSRGLDNFLPKAETGTEKFVSRVGRDAASVMAPMGLARAATPFVGATGQAVTRAMQAMPGTQLAAGAGSGIGGATARTISPDSDMLDAAMSLGGAFMGGAVPTLAQAAGSGLTAAIQPLTRGGQEKIAGQALRAASGSPETLVSRLDDAAGPMVPGSQRTTAESIRSPGLAIMERGIRQSSPQAGEAFALREAQRAAARRELLDRVGGQGPGAPEVGQAIRDLRGGLAAKGEADLAAANSSVRSNLDALGPGQAPELAGADIRGAFETARGAAKSAVSRAYESIDPDGTAVIQSGSLKRAVSDATEKYFGEGSGSRPADVQILIDTVRGVGDNRGFVPWRVLQNLRAQAGVVGKSPDPRASSFAGSVKSAIDDAASAAAAKGGSFTPEQSEAWSRAGSMRRDMGERFQEGAAARVGKTKGYGEDAIPTSAVPGAFFNAGKGGFEDAAKFLKSLGDKPEAVQAIKDYAVFDLRRAATKADGKTVDGGKLLKWMADHRGALQSFPDLRTQLSSLSKAQSAVDEIAARSAYNLADLEKSAAGYFLKQDAGKAIGAVLGSKSAKRDMADLVMRIGGDQKALAGLRRGVIDHLQATTESTTLDAAGGAVVSVDKFVKWVGRHSEALKPLFSSIHQSDLRRIADDMQSQNFPITVARTPGSPTFQNLTTANFLSKVSLGLVDPASPVLSGTVGRALGWLYKAPEQDLQKLLVDAALDPRIARALAAKASPPNIQRASDFLKSRALAIGLGGMPEAEMQESQRAFAPLQSNPAIRASPQHTIGGL